MHASTYKRLGAVLGAWKLRTRGEDFLSGGSIPQHGTNWGSTRDELKATLTRCRELVGAVPFSRVWRASSHWPARPRGPSKKRLPLHDDLEAGNSRLHRCALCPAQDPHLRTVLPRWLVNALSTNAPGKIGTG